MVANCTENTDFGMAKPCNSSVTCFASAVAAFFLAFDNAAADFIIFCCAKSTSLRNCSKASGEVSMLSSFASAFSNQFNTPSISGAYFLVSDLSSCCLKSACSNSCTSTGRSLKNPPSSAEISESSDITASNLGTASSSTASLLPRSIVTA